MITQLLFLGLLSQGKPEEMIRGRVFDGDSVVKNAVVGTSFQFNADPDKRKVQVGYGEPGIKVDENGYFTIPRSAAYSQTLVAETSDAMIGFVSLEKGVNEVKIYVGEAASLKITCNRKDGFGKTPPNMTIFGSAGVIGYFPLAWGDQRVKIPQGELRFTVFHPESVPYEVNVRMTTHREPRMDLNMSPAAWFKLKGKPAPAISPTQVNPKSRVDWESLRGKWVLVDFWATWCAPCVAEMSAYFKFYRDHAADRSRFEILGIHSPDGKSLANIQTSLNGLIKTKWGGEVPPFPLVFDSTGATHRRWGISAYPTTVLVDPKGNVVGQGSIAALQDALAKELLKK